MGRRGRPPKDPAARKDVTASLRMSPITHREIRAVAKDYGRTLSSFVVGVLIPLGLEKLEEQSAEIFEGAYSAASEGGEE